MHVITLMQTGNHKAPVHDQQVLILIANCNLYLHQSIIIYFFKGIHSHQNSIVSHHSSVYSSYTTASSALNKTTFSYMMKANMPSLIKALSLHIKSATTYTIAVFNQTSSKSTQNKVTSFHTKPASGCTIRICIIPTEQSLIIPLK